MTDEERKALIKKLGVKSNQAFDKSYSDVNRQWFVTKIINSLQWQTTAAAAIETQTKDIITESTKLLNARITKGFSSGNLAKKWALYDQKASRAQIIYGMIAMHPEFLKPANADYFDFILERRFRSIQRMNYYVNPNNERNVFAYPDPEATPPQKMKVNGQAEAGNLWQGELGGSLPFILTSLGKANPGNAVETLFLGNTATNRNLFACDPLITTLHLDALLVAKKPNDLLKKLINNGDHYLKIDNPLGHFGNDPTGQRLLGITSAPATLTNNGDIPLGRIGMALSFSKNALTASDLTKNAFIPVRNVRSIVVDGATRASFFISEVNPVTKLIKVSGFGGQATPIAKGAKVYARLNTSTFFETLMKTLPFHFITDSRPSEALFEQVSLKVEDLQVGDHLYVLNHPLYKIFRPEGFWGGEHSFISEIGSRDSAASAFRTELEVEGHGLSDHLLGMASEMLEFINTDLNRVREVTKIHLNNLKTNGRKTTPKVKFSEPTETVNNTPTIMNVFEYDTPYSYSHIKKGRVTKKTINNGFVIKEVKSNPQEFQTFNLNGHKSTDIPKFPQPDTFFRVHFSGGSFSNEQFKLSNWSILFINPQLPAFELYSLFEKDNITPKLLAFDDLAKSKPFFVTDEVNDAYVTRPRVDFTAAYQTFLKTNGAI